MKTNPKPGSSGLTSKKNHKSKSSQLRLAQFILRSRRAEGMTQAELASLCGVNIATIQRIEKASHSTSLENLDKVAAAFGTLAAQILA